MSRVDSEFFMNAVYKTAGVVENSSVPFVETAWTAMTDRFSHFTIAVIFSLIFHEIVYFGLCLPGFMAQFLPFMNQFKIQQEKPETFAIQWNCFKVLLFNHFCVQMPMMAGLYHYNYYMGVSYEYEDIPKWYSLIPQLIGCLIMEDTWHYFMHQLLHHRSIYKYIHKIHHHHQSPFGMTAEYAHWAETMILGMGFVWGILVFGNHLIVEWVWMTVRLLETIEVHSGYDFPYINPLHLIPGYAGARFHDFHHYNFNGNYASTFRWWDWLFGTDKQWREFNASKQELQKVKGE